MRSAHRAVRRHSERVLIVAVALLSTVICTGALTIQRAIYPLALLVGFLCALRGLGASERVLTFRAFARAVADADSHPRAVRRDRPCGRFPVTYIDETLK